MIFYANFNVKTGEFLIGRNKGDAGHTGLPPTDPALYPPRLFTDERSAKRALTWWLKGVTTVYRQSDDWGDADEDWNTVLDRTRNPEDWVTVALDCQLMSTKDVDITRIDDTIRRNFQERR